MFEISAPMIGVYGSTLIWRYSNALGLKCLCGACAMVLSQQEPCPRDSVLAALVIMPLGFGAVAAGRHRAPAPLAGAAVVEEEEETVGIGAAPHLLELLPGQ